MCHYRSAANGQTLPDPSCTPGAISPKVSDATLATTICKTGYTKSIRPPAAITEAEKRANAASYGYIGSLKDAEYDHLVPLSSLAVTPTTRATCGSSPARHPTPKTVLSISYTSLCALVECRWHSPSRRSPPIGPLRPAPSRRAAIVDPGGLDHPQEEHASPD